MQKIHKRTFFRNDTQEMYLYGYDQHTEKPSVELEIYTRQVVKKEIGK